MKIFATYSKNAFTLHINGADTVINLEPHAEKVKVDFVFDNHTGNIDTYSMNVLTTKEPEAEPLPETFTVSDETQKSMTIVDALEIPQEVADSVQPQTLNNSKEKIESVKPKPEKKNDL